MQFLNHPKPQPKLAYPYFSNLFWNLPHKICVVFDEFVQGQLKKDLKNMDMQALAEALDGLKIA